MLLYRKRSTRKRKCCNDHIYCYKKKRRNRTPHDPCGPPGLSKIANERPVTTLRHAQTMNYLAYFQDPSFHDFPNHLPAIRYDHISYPSYSSLDAIYLIISPGPYVSVFFLYFDLRAPSTLYHTWVLPPLHSSITLCYTKTGLVRDGGRNRQMVNKCVRGPSSVQFGSAQVRVLGKIYSVFYMHTRRRVYICKH